MNKNAIQELYSKSNAARAFIDNMGARKRNQSETKIDRTLDILSSVIKDINRKDVIDLFRDLEQVGCGQFVSGRRGYSTRFVWSVSSLGLAKLATGESQSEDTGADTHDELETFQHVFHLRDSFTVSIDLPTDLTKSESQRLALFLQSLPLDD